MENNVYFNQCVDFLARMIEKYGDVVELLAEKEEKADEEQEESDLWAA